MTAVKCGAMRRAEELPPVTHRGTSCTTPSRYGNSCFQVDGRNCVTLTAAPALPSESQLLRIASASSSSCCIAASRPSSTVSHTMMREAVPDAHSSEWLLAVGRSAATAVRTAGSTAVQSCVAPVRTSRPKAIIHSVGSGSASEGSAPDTRDVYLAASIGSFHRQRKPAYTSLVVERSVQRKRSGNSAQRRHFCVCWTSKKGSSGSEVGSAAAPDSPNSWHK
mmetsp:Transcript_63048/g.173192  ORF Transcript_63048/g.173192 Transcript_63048/m.173192 type:complete len:222 (+) Transcript_63048:4364-5029(+)